MYHEISETATTPHETFQKRNNALLVEGIVSLLCALTPCSTAENRPAPQSLFVVFGIIFKGIAAFQVATVVGVLSGRGVGHPGLHKHPGTVLY